MIVITQKAGTLGIFKTVLEKEDRLVCDDRLEFPFVAIGTYEISENDSLMPAPVPVVDVPKEVTMRQAELALLDAGLLDDVEDFIATLSREAQITWRRSSTVQRSNPLIAVVANAKGMTAAQVDQLFITAAGL